MSNLADALKQSGLRRSRSPHKRRKQDFKHTIDRLLAPIEKKRDIQIMRAGSHFKARVRGTAEFCFGADPEEAMSKLLSGRLGRSFTHKRLYGKFADNS